MKIKEALEVLRKEYGCRIAESCHDSIFKGTCEGCEYYSDYRSITDAVKTVLDNFPTQMSETSDAVSRRMVLDALHEYMDDPDYTVGHLHDVICNLPSAQAEQKWIPCSERMPEENADILVTYVDGEETRIIPVNYGRDTWFDCIFNAALDPLKITAWQPLPESYRGDDK